jgi:hypothetical protein
MTLYTGAFLPPAQKLMEFIDASGKTVLKSEDATLNGETWKKRRIVQLKSDLYVEVYDFAARLWEQDVEFGLFHWRITPYFLAPVSDLYRSNAPLTNFLQTTSRVDGAWRKVSTNALADTTTLDPLRTAAPTFPPFVAAAFHTGYRPRSTTQPVVSLQGRSTGAIPAGWRIRNGKLVTSKVFGALNSGVSIYAGSFGILAGNAVDTAPSGCVAMFQVGKEFLDTSPDVSGTGNVSSSDLTDAVYIFGQLALSWAGIRIAQGVTAENELSVPTRWISLPVANRVSFYDDQIFVGFLPEFGDNASWVFVSSVDPSKGNSYPGATGIVAYDTGDTLLPAETDLPSGKQVFAEANSASVAGTHYMAAMALSDLPYASDSVSGGLISSQVYAIGPLGAPEVRGPIAGLLRCHSSVGMGQVGHFNSKKHICLVPTYMFETP